MVESKLGALVGSVREPPSKMMVAMGGLVTLIALLMVVMAVGSHHDTAEKARTAWTLALFVLAVGAGIIWYGVKRGRQLQVYEHGARFAGVVVLFDDVQKVTEGEPVENHLVPVGGLIGDAARALARDAAEGVQLHGSFVKLVIPRSLVNRAPALVERMRQKALATSRA